MSKSFCWSSDLVTRGGGCVRGCGCVRVCALARSCAWAGRPHVLLHPGRPHDWRCRRARRPRHRCGRCCARVHQLFPARAFAAGRQHRSTDGALGDPDEPTYHMRHVLCKRLADLQPVCARARPGERPCGFAAQLSVDGPAPPAPHLRADRQEHCLALSAALLGRVEVRHHAFKERRRHVCSTRIKASERPHHALCSAAPANLRASHALFERLVDRAIQANFTSSRRRFPSPRPSPDPPSSRAPSHAALRPLRLRCRPPHPAQARRRRR